MEEAARTAHKRKTVDQEMADLFHYFGGVKDDDIQHHLEQPWLYKIRDINQKFLFLQNGTLVANPQSSNAEDQFVAVAPNEVIDASKRPIFMGSKDEKYVLIVKSGDRPQLQLEARSIMKLYAEKKELKEFTFYNQTKGSETTCSFESAASPGWFLSTSAEPNKPLGLSQGGGSDITLFYIEKKP